MRYLNEHDPLCPFPAWALSRKAKILYCQCDFIAKVRADERNRCIAEVEALGPLYQFKKWVAEDGYPAFSQETVDVGDALRSQP